MATATSDLFVPAAVHPSRRLPRVRKRTVFSLAVLCIFGAAGIFADFLAPHNPAQANLADALTSPQWAGDHILGTDQIGRDVLSRLLFGIRTSLLVGISSVAIGATVGITLGMLAGYGGRFIEFIVMRLVDFKMSVPGIFVVMLLAFAMGPGLKTTIVALGVVGWVAYARMARAEVRVVGSNTYIVAARAIGCRPLRVALRHTFPNIMNSLVVLSILQFGGAMVSEAAISFLGFGIQSPDSSLGIMLSDGRAFLGVAWWPAAVPAVAIFTIILALNLCGEGFQDWIDPVRRNR